MSGGGEVWSRPSVSGHGFLLAAWRWRVPESPVQLDVEFDTDTLRVGLSDVPIGNDFRLYGRLAGEYPFAGLLPDYYRRGRRLSSRGFRAGYAAGTGGVQWRSDPHFARLEATGRRWFFERTAGTEDALRLPAEAWVAEPRLHYTFWQVVPDSSQWQPHQPFHRIRGLALGVTVGADLRSSTRSWGARNPSFDPRDPRNDPASTIGLVRQWGRAGWRLGRRVRLQASEQIRWGTGEDDLSRDRIGGLNPYVVSVAGLPWAALVSGRYAAAHLELRWEILRDHELGLFGDAAAVADPRRTGARNNFGPAAGGGFLVDLRFGDAKIDARIGSALPADWLAVRPIASAWLSAGHRW